MPLLKSSELTSGFTRRRIEVARDRRLEREAHAELLEDDGDGVGNALDDRHRELAARQEAGLLAVVGDEIGLGQALEIALLTPAP